MLKQAKVKIWYLFRYKPKIIRILQHNKLQNFQNVQKTLYFQIDDERPGEFDNFVDPPMSKWSQDFKDNSKVGENYNAI